MGMFNVPQFIDIEDKIVGPLTAKQLGWLGAEGVILLVAWSILDMSLFIIVAVILTMIFGALAFFKPHGQPFILFLLSAVSFFTKPKMYVWRRVADIKAFSRPAKPKTAAQKKAAAAAIVPKKEISRQKIEDISKLLEINKR
ncbi:MAG: PrgI family protein [Candidatus Moranbacteria bacterium]|nr:PrgI family protein [Candidatus Moranbacteria bacterium]